MRAGRQEVWPPHYVVMVILHTALLLNASSNRGPAPAFHTVARLADAGRSGGLIGPTLVVRQIAGQAVEHPGNRVAAHHVGAAEAPMMNKCSGAVAVVAEGFALPLVHGVVDRTGFPAWPMHCC